MNRSNLILGIESSCDETAAAVVAEGRYILSNIVASQADFHKQFGGVVPEIASRMHVEAILPVIDQALNEAGTTLEQISAVAVTHGPGLVGALLVGLSAAKGLALVANKPLIGVQHIAGHIAANYLADNKLEPPFLCLVVSGAHSHLVMVKDYTDFEVIARTRDDAAGEAFDKLARALGLGYPGGPLIDSAAIGGNTSIFKLPRTHFIESFDFSFSGLKTAALNKLNQLKQQATADQTWQDIVSMQDFAATFQQSIVEVLVDHTIEAAKKFNVKQIVLAGGVSANSALRGIMKIHSANAGFRLSYPPIELCTDNAAMIASAGYYNFKMGKISAMNLDAVANLKLL